MAWVIPIIIAKPLVTIRYLNRIDKESGRMNQLIDQIIHIQSLQMTRYQSDTLETASVDMSQLLEGIRQDVCFEFQTRAIKWQLMPPLEGVVKPINYRVYGHYEQLYSAFENIIRNAFEHSPPSSTVTIAIRQTSLGSQTPALQIDVMDEGNGIDSPSDRERIFQPFVRLNMSRSRPDVTPNDSPLVNNAYREKSSGYGLGLAIAHAIIKAHHGDIRAYNRYDETIQYRDANVIYAENRSKKQPLNQPENQVKPSSSTQQLTGLVISVVLPQQRLSHKK